MSISVNATFEDIVREIEASGPTVSNLLRWYVADADKWMRAIDELPDAAIWIAMVKTLPDEVVEYLSKHEDEEVRLGIAMSSMIDGLPNIRSALLEDPVLRVRTAAIRNT